MFDSSFPIENNITYFKWIGKQEFDKMHKITSSHVDELKLKWGKQDSILKNEYKMYLWKKIFKDYEFHIYSGKGKGTCIEVVTSLSFNEMRENKELGKIIIEFIEWFITEVNQ